MNKAKKYKLKLDYTKEELEELKLLGKVCDSPMTAVWQVAETQDRSGIFRKLQARYMTIGNEDKLDFMTDINNAVMGTDIFPEQKYYVRLPKLEFPYLVQDDDGMELVRYLRSGYKEEFTEQEIKDIDPRYMAFAVPAEE